MKKNLEILEFEDKTSTNGKGYTRFKTSKGWMSCFNSDTVKALKDLKGKSAEVEINETTSGDKTFSNIVKCFGEADVVEVVKVGEVSKQQKSHTTMYVSYVKDLIVAGKEPVEAIKIVKEIRKEFE